MFVGVEQLLSVSFTTAWARLRNLTRDGVLAAASDYAYRGEMTDLARARLMAFASGVSTLAQVHVQEFTTGGDSAHLALRWEVSRPGGGLFPVLDANITLAAADEHAAKLILAGVYRHPPGAMSADDDRAALHSVAAGTVRAFLSRVSEAISHPARAAGPGPEAADSPAWTQRPRPRRAGYEKDVQD